jgi:hypothetical protein
LDNFEEKLNAVLSSPEAMDKVMNVARSLGNSGGNALPPAGSAAEPIAQAPDLSSLLGGIDPAVMTHAMRLLGAYNRGGDPQKAALMQAVKPYLRPARRDRVDKAMQTLKLANVAKEALGTDIVGNLLGGILGKR